MKTDLGYIRGAQGEVGPQGETGAQGPAATIEVGSVTTSAYGTPAKVVNSGTENAARFNFTIPQGAPGETVADVSELTANFITESTKSYPTYTVTEKMKVILGKIKKYLADLKSEAASLASKIAEIKTDVGGINKALTGKLDKTDVIANLTATTSGKALDATQGKALQDQITQLNSDLPIFDYGTVTITASSNGEGTTEIQYSKRFSSNPSVFITLGNDTNNVGSWMLGLAAVTVPSKTSFKIIIKNIEGVSRAINVYWLAVGK